MAVVGRSVLVSRKTVVAVLVQEKLTLRVPTRLRQVRFDLVGLVGHLAEFACCEPLLSKGLSLLCTLQALLQGRGRGRIAPANQAVKKQR